MRSKIVLYASFLLALSCNSKPANVDIEGFNSYQWKRDKYGCGNRRLTMRDAVVAAQDQFTGLTEKEVISVLGKPDGHELYGRGQKFLVYLTEPNPRCRAKNYNSNRPEKVPSVYVRLDALGRANEVFIEQF
jgi:hypothetical protein